MIVPDGEGRRMMRAAACAARPLLFGWRNPLPDRESVWLAQLPSAR
jgi:hypothetical protein